MGKIADGLDDTADKMAALDAPDDAKDELDTFVKEVKASADQHARGGRGRRWRQDLEKMTAAS